MVNVCDRWDSDKTDNLQSAFFNGVGYESWENIWGIWNEITPRDAEALRRVAKIERAVRRVAGQPGLGAAHSHRCSTASSPASCRGSGATLWTMVNRNDYDVAGQQTASSGTAPGMRYFDLWHGVELKPEVETATPR